MICIAPSHKTNNDHIADDDAEKGEEIDKEDKGKLVDTVDDLRVNTKEKKGWFSIINYNFRMHLQNQVRCTLTEVYGRMLHFPEHDSLGGGQGQGHQPGADHHQPATYQRQLVISHYSQGITLLSFSPGQTGELP